MSNNTNEIQLSCRAATYPEHLSERELAFLKLACSERTYFQIAREMYVSDRTVDGYRDSVFRKLNVGSRVGLVIYAVKHGIVRF
jgi:DNA-binding CsgD family transcriptional regulator